MSYTVSFFINGYGQQPVDLVNITVLPELPVLTEEGFTFDGWFLDEDLTIKAEAGMEITSDILLYAAWARDWTKNTGLNTYAIDADKELFDPSATTTFDFRDALGNKFINNWATAYNIPACLRGSDSDTQFTLQTYLEFKDSSNTPLKGYILPGWVSSSTHVYGPGQAENIHYYTGNTKILGVKKGCLPTIKATDVTERRFPGSDMKFTTSAVVSSNTKPTSGYGSVKPFYILGKAGDYSLIRYDNYLYIYDAAETIIQTFYPSDFRDGVIPEYIYVLLQGAGGAGAYAGGGGAGAWLGAVVDLKTSYTIGLVVGSGGVAPGGNGGDTKLLYELNGARRHGYLYAKGGKGASGSTGGAGGVCVDDGTCIQQPIDIFGDQINVFFSINYSKGGKGGNTGQAGGSPAAGESYYDMVTLGEYTSATYLGYLPKEATHHLVVKPYLPVGGRSFNTGEGAGGGASIFGPGSNGGGRVPAGNGLPSYYTPAQSAQYSGAGGGGGYIDATPANGAPGCIYLFY